MALDGEPGNVYLMLDVHHLNIDVNAMAGLLATVLETGLNWREALSGAANFESDDPGEGKFRNRQLDDWCDSGLKTITFHVDPDAISQQNRRETMGNPTVYRGQKLDYNRLQQIQSKMPENTHLTNSVTKQLYTRKTDYRKHNVSKMGYFSRSSAANAKGKIRGALVKYIGRKAADQVLNDCQVHRYRQSVWQGAPVPLSRRPCRFQK